MKSNLPDRFLDFSICVFKTGKKVTNSYEGQHVYRQLFRSSTSVAANYQESQSAESRADFIHKLQIVLKELKESLFWLRFIETSGIAENKNDVSFLL